MTTGNFVGGGNQCIQLVCQGFCTVNCRPSVRQLQAFPHKIRVFELQTSESGGEPIITNDVSNGVFTLVGSVVILEPLNCGR